jgi:hypothetical protein
VLVENTAFVQKAVASLKYVRPTFLLFYLRLQYSLYKIRLPKFQNMVPTRKKSLVRLGRIPMPMNTVKCTAKDVYEAEDSPAVLDEPAKDSRAGRITEVRF